MHIAVVSLIDKNHYFFNRYKNYLLSKTYEKDKNLSYPIISELGMFFNSFICWECLSEIIGMLDTTPKTKKKQKQKPKFNLSIKNIYEQ